MQQAQNLGLQCDEDPRDQYRLQQRNPATGEPGGSHLLQSQQVEENHEYREDGYDNQHLGREGSVDIIMPPNIDLPCFWGAHPITAKQLPYHSPMP